MMMAMRGVESFMWFANGHCACQSVDLGPAMDRNCAAAALGLEPHAASLACMSLKVMLSLAWVMSLCRCLILLSMRSLIWATVTLGRRLYMLVGGPRLL